jgi:hydroxyethylthiazole kinase
MIISPPFIPSPIAGETDDAFLARAMVGGIPGDGGFPLSFDLNWHGGMHLTAPQENGSTLPVRAISDGTLVYYRNPTPNNAIPDHPLNFRGAWTDNGCVVLRHETEVGEGETANVVFYSIYMHLSKINIVSLLVGGKVTRKSSIGEAGSIYGQKGRIHFEIIAGSSDISNLVGRNSRDLNHKVTSGRKDSCWGDMYFFVAPEVLVYDQPPHDRSTPVNSGEIVYRPPNLNAMTPVQEGASLVGTNNTTTVEGYAPEIASALQEGIFVRLQYRKGGCIVTSLYMDGEEIGSVEEEAESEYKIYDKANRYYPQSPSAGYEILRFGRILGLDTLPQANSAHWRKIRLPNKIGSPIASGWVNLNAGSVTQFSDADFPQWDGWQLVDDDVDSDSHCQSEAIKSLLGLGSTLVTSGSTDVVSLANGPEYVGYSADEKSALSERFANERELGMAALIRPEVQRQLKRLICKFPTEWSSDDFDTRYSWLLRVADGGAMLPDQYEKLKAHQNQLAFWEHAGLDGLDKIHWHFPPREFIRHYRKCGWLSNDELMMLIAQAPVVGKQRAAGLRVETNKMLRKYLVSESSLRLSHFFAQVGIETGWWQYREEIGNESYFRTMYEVMTPSEAGSEYDRAVNLNRNLPSGRRPVELANAGPNPKPTINRPNYIATRPGQIAAKAAGVDNGIANASHGGAVGDGARFHGRGFLQITGRRNYKSYQTYRGKNFTTDPNPALLSSNDYNACDASGFFWAREKISKYADAGGAEENCRTVGSVINRGSPNKVPLHDLERKAAFKNIWSVISDEI